MGRARAISGAADQIFSSLSNGLIIYAVAVVTPSENFGRVALLLMLLSAAIGALRGALGVPLLLSAGRVLADIRREGSYAVTSVLMVSPIIGGVMWAVGGPEIRLPTIWIIIATPIVLVEDVLRYIAIAEGRAHVAAIWDAVWFVGSAVLLLATWLHSPLTTTAYLIGGWTVLAFIALAGMLAGVRVTPRRRGYSAWICDGWQHRARYGVDSGLEPTTAFALLLFVTLLVSAEVTAALRGAAALFAPISVAESATPLVVIPESKRLSMSPPQVWRSLARISMATTAGALLLGAVMFFMPVSVGKLVLGSTFEATQSIVPIFTLEYAIAAWIFAVAVLLRAFTRSADALTLKIIHVFVALTTVLGSAVIFRTAAGVAAGIAAATAFIAVVALLRFKPRATQSSPSSPDRLPVVEPLDSPSVSPASAGGHSADADTFAAPDTLNIGVESSTVEGFYV